MNRTFEHLTVLLCVALILPCVYSQREDYELFPWQFNKFFFWSSKAPMTKALDKIPDVVNGVKAILDHFERVERAIYARVGSRVPPNGDEILQPCLSTDTVAWPRAVNSNLGARGFPKPDLSCITDFPGVHLTNHEEPPYTVDRLYEATAQRTAAIVANAKSIASTFIDVKTNYTGPDFIGNLPYSTTTATCILHPVHGVRANGGWRLATGIHNRPVTESLPLLARKNIVEYHRVDNGHLGNNLLMRLPVRPATGTKRIIRDDATTLMVNARGHGNPSMYRLIPIAENPAIIESLDMADISIQQAEDAVTPSNIAILVLPLALNIVPIALIAHVSTTKMLLYLIWTDMLTVIPLLIKGIELIFIQSTRHRAVVLRMSSSLNSTLANASGAEMWAAECQARENVRDVGIIFVVLSVVFLVVGIVLELAARSYVESRRRRGKLYASSDGSSSMSAEKVVDESGLSQLDSRTPSDFSSVVYIAQVPRTYSAGIYSQNERSGKKDKKQVRKLP